MLKPSDEIINPKEPDARIDRIRFLFWYTMKDPEKYQDLIVRIDGFSARFVTLNPVVQREIIERTTYGG